MSVKAGTAELLYAYIDVEPIGFNRGFYSVDVRFYYRITADAFVGTVRPVEITGLAVFDKRAILFGGEGTAKSFSSRGGTMSDCVCTGCAGALNAPNAVVEVVDPLILGMKMIRVGDCCNDCCNCGCECMEIPACIMNGFPDGLVTSGEAHRLFVTLGQFSIIRMERDTQVLVPIYDYSLPEKECDGGGFTPEDPCEVFRQVKFPVEEFFPAGGGKTAQNCVPGKDYRSNFRC